MPEVRFETEDTRTLAVIDGFATGTNTCRTKVINSILKAWADAKSHESMMVCRVAGINPAEPDTSRR